PGRAIQTRAVKKGDRYFLNGTKVWISGTGQSDWGLVFARTGDKGRGGVTSFIVEKKFKGFSYKPIPVIRSYFPYEISLQDSEVHRMVVARDLLGGQRKKPAEAKA